MIGKIVFRRGPNRLEAALDEETHWHCRDVEWERFLNESCRFAGHGSAEEALGCHALCQAAGILNGEAIFM